MTKKVRGAVAGPAKVPDEVEDKIVQLLKMEDPESIPVLKLSSKVEEKFPGTKCSHKDFGFETPFDMAKSIKSGVEVFFHEDLHLWVAKYKEPPSAGEGVVVDEVGEHEEVQGGGGDGEQGGGGKEGDKSSGNGNEDEGGSGVVEAEIKEEVDTDTESINDKELLPPPSQSVASFVSTSSSGSVSSTRRNRLPPPPPSVDWTNESKSILGKRQGSRAGGADGKRMDVDDVMSISSVDETIPVQQNQKLDQDKRHVRYIPSDKYDLEYLSFDALILGRTISVQQDANYVDTNFCSRNILEQLMEVKYRIRNVGADRYKNLQDRMQDFGKGPIFHYADAYLLANIDALTGWCVTKPAKKHGELLVSSPGEILVAVDICGGPGGFAEYILTKLQWEAKVFGFTLADEQYEYQLSRNGHFPVEAFERWMGRDGRRGDGSIYKPDFATLLKNHILRITGYKGCHVVVAGGKEIDPTVDEDRKELRAKAMIMAETNIAFKVLREGGTFVLRMYDMFTSFSVGIVYILYRAFESVTIIRPDAIRPGSSERFVVCKQFKGGKIKQEISNYLDNCQSMDWGAHVNHKYQDEQQADILEIIPIATIKNASRFYDYVYEMNAELGLKQLNEINSICKSIQFRNDINAAQERVKDIRWRCAHMWRCPRAYRQDPKHAGLAPDVFANKLLRPYPDNILRRVEREGETLLSYPVMERDLTNAKEWHFVCVGRDRGFYMSMGGQQVYRFTAGQWKQVTTDNVEMADHTLVYGDVVDEVTQYEGKQIIVTAFHIIDGLVLGGRNIRDLPYTERMEMCTKFAKSMDKSAREDYIHIRAKKSLDVTRLEAALGAVHKDQVKGGGDRKKRPLAPVDLSDSKTSVHAHTGYLFLKSIKEGGVHADFLVTMQNRLYWQLDDVMDRNPQGPLLPRPKDQKKLKETVVCAPALVHHINNMGSQPSTSTGPVVS